MPESILIRNATKSDIDFIVDCIVQAEKGTGTTISYCHLFDITENEFREVTGEILDEGIRNFEFSIESFKIAESDGKYAGAYGAWLEGADGISSGILKMSAYRTFLKKENLQNYKALAGISNQIGFIRQPGTLQFEYIFIPVEFRGRNIGSMLVESLSKSLQKQYPHVDMAFVQVMKHNAVSLQAHLKYGFKVVEQKTGTNNELLNIFSGMTRVLLKKQLK
jgi:ribosomal protein S18 acetylase RimI-like enzyme